MIPKVLFRGSKDNLFPALQGHSRALFCTTPLSQSIDFYQLAKILPVPLPEGPEIPCYIHPNLTLALRLTENMGTPGHAPVLPQAGDQ